MKLTTMLTFIFYYPKAYRKTYMGVDMGTFPVLDFISTASCL